MHKIYFVSIEDTAMLLCWYCQIDFLTEQVEKHDIGQIIIEGVNLILP